MQPDFSKHFARDRQVCGGEMVIKGTRVTIRTLLASLAEGASEKEILADFPTVSSEDLKAVIAYAAAAAGDDIPLPPSVPVPAAG